MRACRICLVPSDDLEHGICTDCMLDGPIPGPAPSWAAFLDWIDQRRAVFVPHAVTWPTRDLYFVADCPGCGRLVGGDPSFRADDDTPWHLACASRALVTARLDILPLRRKVR